jgi:hypothetical protein
MENSKQKCVTHAQVEELRQKHIHLKSPNPVGFVHLFGDIEKLVKTATAQGHTEGVRETKELVLSWFGEDYNHEDYDWIVLNLKALEAKDKKAEKLMLEVVLAGIPEDKDTENYHGYVLGIREGINQANALHRAFLQKLLEDK